MVKIPEQIFRKAPQYSVLPWTQLPVVWEKIWAMMPLGATRGYYHCHSHALSRFHSHALSRQTRLYVQVSHHCPALPATKQTSATAIDTTTKDRHHTRGAKATGRDAHRLNSKLRTMHTHCRIQGLGEVGVGELAEGTGQILTVRAQGFLMVHPLCLRSKISSTKAQRGHAKSTRLLEWPTSSPFTSLF